VVSVTVGARAAESDVADLLRETEAANPGVAIGSYPFFRDGRYGANFVIRSTDADSLEACRADLVARLEAEGRSVVEEGI
jgi:molybdopterin-biosynthesis enzyme MoeA-like protein